ncbi:MAG TPA: flagellar basal body L-ring protein FlgH [bacterium]|nr:flagellar basal body L-ring protein FlgH [bacterium]
MKRIIAFLIIVGCAFPVVQAQTFQSIYSDHKARTPGDLLTVLIVEFTEAQNKANTKTRSSDASSASASASGALMDYFPDLGFSGQVDNEYSGSGSNSRTGSLKSKITVRIDSVLSMGIYQVSGTRVLDVNNEKQIMTLTGVVRARDIQPDNTIYSYNVADADIMYEGRGIVEAAHKPGILRRVLNWIF